MRVALCLILSVCLVISSSVWIKATDELDQNSSWTSPSAITLKRVSDIQSAQHTSISQDNIDCQLTSYRLVNSSEMRTGCFVPTAFGLMDTSDYVVIFNGTDEGVPIIPKVNGQILVPWPNAGTLIVLSPQTTGGEKISLYSSPLASMQDQRNILLQLESKKLAIPPDIQLKDASGQALVINSGTMAISDGGSWLVAETLNGYFVRINLATLNAKQFAPAYVNNSGTPSKIAVSEDGRFVAIQNNNASEFKVYDLKDCSTDICSHHDYKDFLTTKVGSIKTIHRLRFSNQSLLSFEVTATNKDLSGVYLLSPRGSIDNLTEYIGLGDSYTSGEGAFDYRSGTDDESNLCHLSVNSYPYLLTKGLFSSIGGHSVACSGATIKDIGSNNDSYKGQIKNGPSLGELKNNSSLLESIETNYLPGMIAQHRFIKRWQPRIATVSIGGNDVGFGDILEQCVMPKLSMRHGDSICFSTYEDRVEVKSLIDRTVGKWVSLFNQLKSESPNTQLYVIGYPDIIDDKGNCALNVHLSKSELEFAKELVVYINQSIKSSANQANVPYVDISKALVGHRLCETKSHNIAVNGLTAGDDSFVFGHESYHPNTLGHQLIEQEILRKTNNLTPFYDSPDTGPTINLVNAPASGRAIFNRQPAKITSRTIKKGGSAIISLPSYSLKPNTSYSVKIGGITGQTIATIQTSTVGGANSTINIPPDTASGPTTIDIVGDGLTDDDTDITQPIYIPENDNDFDGDNIPNTQDSCLGTLNSGIDNDQDNIDDVCDPVTTNEDSSSGSSGSSHYATNSNPSSNNSIDPNLQATQTLPELTSSFMAQGSSISVNSRLMANNTRLNIGRVGQKLTLGKVKGVRKFQTSAKNNNFTNTTKTNNSLEKIQYKNPINLWWFYLFLIPLTLWLLLKVAQKLNHFYGRRQPISLNKSSLNRL